MHHTMISGTLLSVLSVLLAFALSPTKRDFLGTFESLFRMLPHNQIGRICVFLEEAPDYARMWMESDRLRGVISRFHIATIYVRIIQLHYRDGRISREEAQYVWGRIVLQAWFSMLVLPEVLLCRLWSQIPRLAAKASIGFYCEIVMRSNILCTSPSSPTCMLKLNELL